MASSVLLLFSLSYPPTSEPTSPFPTLPVPSTATTLPLSISSLLSSPTSSVTTASLLHLISSNRPSPGSTRPHSMPSSASSTCPLLFPRELLWPNSPTEHVKIRDWRSLLVCVSMSLAVLLLTCRRYLPREHHCFNRQLYLHPCRLSADVIPQRRI